MPRGKTHVKVKKNKKGSRLLEAIQKQLLQFSPNYLKVWFATETDGADGKLVWLSSDAEAAQRLKLGQIHPHIEALISEAELDTTRAIETLLNEKKLPDLEDGQIHVLVQVPGPRRDSSKEWREKFLARQFAHHQLPSIESLGDFVAQALPEKIRVRSKYLWSWSQLFSPQLQEKLFVVDNAAPCEAFTLNVLSRLVKLAQCGDTAKRNPRLRQRIPDFLFILNDVCVFRGEEEAPGVDLGLPGDELTGKLVWNYDNIPYLLGYAASGYRVNLFALQAGGRGSSEVTKHRIGSFNLETVEERFRMVLALLNLSLLFTGIAEAPDQDDDVKTIHRPSGGVVRLYPAFVTKYYPVGAILYHLARVYGALREGDVPNVDHLTKLDFKLNIATFEPRGEITASPPRDLPTLFAAVKDVLQALVALHRVGWIHRDIRWPNVVKQRDRDAWFLIDFVDSATSPHASSSRDHLRVEEHAPEMFVNGMLHTTAVDIWAVGYLIECSRVDWDAEPKRTAFRKALMHQDPEERPSAEQALRELTELQQEALPAEEGQDQSWLGKRKHS